jgi:hypothetical protein
VVFAGPLSLTEYKKYMTPNIKDFKYICTKNIKPSQCYEIARRECNGETISWIADDCTFSENCYGKAYEYWKSMDCDKLILSIQTMEDGQVYNMRHHSFVGFDKQTPLMAPLCLMSRKFLDDLGGLDKRYIAGQYENDIVMRAYADGGNVLIFKDGQCNIEHMKVHGNEHKFRIAYLQDRAVLEGSWGKRGEFLSSRRDKFEPFSDKHILIQSQSNNIDSIWQ